MQIGGYYYLLGVLFNIELMESISKNRACVALLNLKKFIKIVCS